MRAKKPRSVRRLALSGLLVAGIPTICGAANDQLPFSPTLELQVFGARQGLMDDSPVNPGNALGIPKTVWQLDVRPDFTASGERITFDFKPRLRAYDSDIEGSQAQGFDESDTDAFVNEWLLRYQANEKLYVSAGREDLQWGPSSLLSPSNPFNRDNNRNTPRMEQPGLDYVRAVYLPNSSWTASFIANVDEGEFEMDDFRKTYASKIDYVGDRKYASVIPSYTESGDDGAEAYASLGFYGSVAVDDATLLYSEGTVSEDSDRSGALVGVSYTFMDTSVLTAEYYYQSNGCDLEPFSSCVDPDPEASAEALFNSLFRRNYFLLQYYRDLDEIDTRAVLRWIHDADDSSDRLNVSLVREVGQRYELFAVGNLTTGGLDSEFGSLVDYSIQLGASVKF